MIKRLLSLLFFLFVVGFTFFYTNKAVIFARQTDPLMQKIINSKDVYKIDKIEPIINNNEYIYGLNGCIVNEEDSYNKMKNTKEFNEKLIVLSEDEIKSDTNNKYIISGNKEFNNVSIVLIVKKRIKKELLDYFKTKNIDINFFIDSSFLENNIEYVEDLKEYGNIYNFGRNNKYIDNYISYDNSLLESISNNKSNYCLTDIKNKDMLELCNKNNMEVIKSKYISENILSNIKYSINNGDIIVINNINENTSAIKVTINYILSKGFKIKYLNDLLKLKKDCDYISK